MEFERLALGTLATWRLVHLLAAEDGPWDLVARLRRRAGDGRWGRLLDCFYCLSLWVAAPLALLLGTSWRERGLLWLSLSAGAILIERLIPERPSDPLPAPFIEATEAPDVVLRPPAPTDPPGDDAGAQR
jgi:hypothetical protein